VWSFAGADEQVAGAGRGAVGDRCGGALLDQAEADQVVADAAGPPADVGLLAELVP
jgi:hypothetical protein